MGAVQMPPQPMLCNIRAPILCISATELLFIPLWCEKQRPKVDLEIVLDWLSILVIEAMSINQNQSYQPACLGDSFPFSVFQAKLQMRCHTHLAFMWVSQALDYSPHACVASTLTLERTSNLIQLVNFVSALAIPLSAEVHYSLTCFASAVTSCPHSVLCYRTHKPASPKGCPLNPKINQYQWHS